MAVKVYGSNHVVIEVDDAKKAMEFYADVFNLEIGTVCWNLCSSGNSDRSGPSHCLLSGLEWRPQRSSPRWGRFHALSPVELGQYIRR